MSAMTDVFASSLAASKVRAPDDRPREDIVKSIHRMAVATGATALFSFAPQIHAADTLAPQAPQIVGAVSRNCTSIDLTWQGGYEPEADEAQTGLARFEIRSTSNQFRVYNGTGSNDTVPWTYLRDNLNRPVRYARIGGLKPGAAYEFSVTALDKVNNRSAARVFPIVTVLSGAAQCSDVTPPPTPDINNLQFYSTSTCHDAEGAITDLADAGLEGYFVYLDGVRASFAPSPSPRVRLSSLTPRRQYQVALQAVDKAGNVSPISAQRALSVPACAPRLTGELNVWSQAFYFKGDAVPAAARLAYIPKILHDANGANVENRFNVDRYLRESSFDTVGLKNPAVNARWTQLPKTAAEYGCTLQNGEYWGCSPTAIVEDARVAHPLHATIEIAYPLRVYFVDRLNASVTGSGEHPHVLTGLFPDLQAVSIRSAPMIRDALTQQYAGNASRLHCPGPGTGNPNGSGNAPALAQDVGFGCFDGGTDFSVTPNEFTRTLPHPSAVWKHWLGWIPGGQVTRAIPPFSGLVYAADRKSSLVQLLTVPVPASGGRPDTPSYALEYISGMGLNAGQPTGLAIRYFGNVLAGHDMGSLRHIDTLAPGESFVDPHRGLKIELLRTLSGIAAQVRVCNTTPGVASDGSFSSVCLN